MYNNLFGKRLFLLGIFLLPTAPAISVVFLLISALISLKNNFLRIFTDKLNLIFAFLGLLLPLICLQHENIYLNQELTWQKSLTWVGLINWLPLIFGFLTFQYYLKDQRDRVLSGKLLIYGSVPILLSGIAQYVFKLYGPFEAFNGLIIWFQRAPSQSNLGLTSIFSNQNYAGTWFCIIWPFCLSLFLNSTKKNINKFISLFFLIIVTICLFLTTSRNALVGMIFLIPLMVEVSPIIWFIPFLIIGSMIIYYGLTILFPVDLYFSFENFLPFKFWQELNLSNLILNESRWKIWEHALIFISEKPFFGWGAAAFPLLYEYKTNSPFYAGHPHNIFFEVAISYGLPVAISIFMVIFTICRSAYLEIFKNSSYYKIDLFERAWFSSFIVLLFSQFLDLQYFDGRISCIFWILLAGLKEINGDKNKQKIQEGSHSYD